jgi:hypothetical protein
MYIYMCAHICLPCEDSILEARFPTICSAPIRDIKGIKIKKRLNEWTSKIKRNFATQ